MQTMGLAMRAGEDISSRSQLKLVAALSIPAILEQLAITMMGYIDTAMVGSLGASATAAIGVVASTTWLFNGLVGAVALGFSVQIAQYLGAGREEDGRTVLRQAILFNIFCGLALGMVAVGLGRVLPQLLRADVAIQGDAGAYFSIVGAFLPMNMASMIYSGILRCSGNVRLPSLMNVGMCLLDVLFNFFLIYPSRYVGGVWVWGAGLGVRGAALGTGLAMSCVSMVLLWRLVRGKSPLRLRRGESWRFTGVCLRNAMRLGTPAALERVTLCCAQIVLTAVVNGMGTVAVAANYIAVQAEAICYLPAYGVAAAATTLVGQSIGAGRPDMAKRFARSTVVVGFVLVAVMGLLMFLTAPWLAGLLTPEAEVVAMSTTLLRIVSLCEPLFAVSIVTMGALRGAGDSKGPFFLNLWSMWGVRVVAVLLMAPRYGLVSVWICMTGELMFRGGLFLHRLLRGRWLEIERLG